MPSTKADESLNFMPSVSSADMPVHFGLHLEKENDHPLRKSGKQHHHSDEAAIDHIAARLPLLVLAPTGQETALVKPSAALDILQKTPSPALLKPTGTCTPMLSPYLKELSSPSPGSSQASPLSIPNLMSTKGMIRPVRPMKKVASTSPDCLNTLSVGDAQDQLKSAQNALPMRPKPGARSVVRVRARRALTLGGEKSKPVSPDQVPNRRSVCSKSVGDLSLSGACLQSAARANLSRSADWPTSSAACIRKRTDEDSGYEMPRKSSRHEDPSWHSATACLARLSLRGSERHVSFGKATLLGTTMMP